MGPLGAVSSVQPFRGALNPHVQLYCRVNAWGFALGADAQIHFGEATGLRPKDLAVVHRLRRRVRQDLARGPFSFGIEDNATTAWRRRDNLRSGIVAVLGCLIHFVPAAIACPCERPGICPRARHRERYQVPAQRPGDAWNEVAETRWASKASF